MRVRNPIRLPFIKPIILSIERRVHTCILYKQAHVCVRVHKYDEVKRCARTTSPHRSKRERASSGLRRSELTRLAV